MSGLTKMGWRATLSFAGIAGALALGAVIALPSPAQAYWIGVGAPCCGWYGPSPYWGYPPPYYYAPPPRAYYPPPTGAYPPASAPAPSAYTPPTGPAPAAPAAPTAGITYTNKPAFRNPTGQTCREYSTHNTGGQTVYGTACQASDGQWRVVN